MKIDKLKDTVGGWFVGDFFKATLRTKDFEVAYKTYKAGTAEMWHQHRIATELTVIIEGCAHVNFDIGGDPVGLEVLREGDILRVEPGEGISFKAITDVKTIVVKSPSVPNDKYYTKDIEPACTECGEKGVRLSGPFSAYGGINNCCARCMDSFK